MSTPTMKDFVLQKELFLGSVKIHTIRRDRLLISMITSLEGKVSLDEERQDAQDIIAQLSILTDESFGNALDGGSSDGTKRVLQGSEGLILLHDEFGIAGFASSFFSKADVFYLQGIAIASRIKGRGVARQMIQMLWQASGMNKIAFTTQNPLMFCLLRSVCVEVYPNLTQGVPEKLQSNILTLRDGRVGILDPTLGIIYNLYEKCLYPQLPTCNDSEVSAWFDKMLCVTEGKTRNSFIFVGEGLK